MPVITIPKALRDKLGDEAAESFAMLLKVVEHEGRNDALVLAEEKFERKVSEEVASLKVNIGEVKAGIEARISEVKAELEAKISEVKADLEAKISEVRADIIKWMFIFWAGQIVVLIAILQIFFHK
ncbi:MAG: hypothetical protein OHK0032_05860 [Thermodesulfovibrionales bacterium]